MVNVGGDHWIALIVDFASKAVYYFDSLKQCIDSELQEAYDW
jgi:Ulp1 family protease